MIIFLVLILILVALFAGVGYLNRKKVFTRTNNLENDSDELKSSTFNLDPEYYSLKNTWKEMTPNSSLVRETCYNTQMCNGDLKCYKNPITNQQACFSQPTDGFADEINTGTLTDYSIPKLYTAICSQKKKDERYETYYPNNIEEGSNSELCNGVLFQGIVNDTATCYDVDQLHGTKVVELCTAQPNTNNICINDDGDRVYYPEFNTERLKKDLTVCEDNTSINYITLNYNNSPQTINEFEQTNKNGYSFSSNQLFCLQTTSVYYYPAISITKEDDQYFLEFEGSWGFVYKIKINKDSDSIITTIGEGTDYEDSHEDSLQDSLQDFNKYDKPTLVNNLRLDFTARGITYKFPTIKNITSTSFEIWKDTKLKTVNLGTTVDVSSLHSSFMPNATIDLKPCAPFDPSYKINTKYGNLQDINYTDRQRFKVSRFALGSDGKLTPNSDGLVSSIVYRELNYSNGGLYLDYSINPENLILRPMNSDSNNESKKWLLMKPLETSPYTLPSSSDAWCNYSYDTSSDGGRNFNGKTGVITPMTSIKVRKGQDIIDPLYKEIANQPNNRLFNAIATPLTLAALPFALPAGTIGGPVGIGALEGVAITHLASNGFSLFNWQNSDPSFVHCAQLCGNPVSIVPRVKAVALNSGNLGSSPPGHILSLTQDFAEGDKLFGVDIHAANTCQFYKKYDTSGDAPLEPIFTRNIGDIYSDGEVDFIIKDTFEDTYFFDIEYFNERKNLTLDRHNTTPTDSNYGQTQLEQNVISKIYQKNLQIFSRTVFTTSSDPLERCGCNSGDNNIGNMITPGCDISKNTGDECSSKLADVVKQLNKKHSADGTKYGYFLKDIDNTLDIQLTFFDYYNSSHVNSQAITLLSAKINFGSVPNENNLTIPLTPEKYRELGNLDRNVESSIVLFRDPGDPGDPGDVQQTGDDKMLYDKNGKELTVDLEYSDFTRVYRLYYTSPIDNTEIQIAVVEPVIKEDGRIDIEQEMPIVSIDYEQYYSNLTANHNQPLDLELREYHIMPYTINDYTIILEHRVNIINPTTIRLRESTTEWKIDERAPRHLKGQGTNGILLTPGEYPISLIKDNVLKHGPSPQQMAYLGSFSDVECSSIEVESCETNQYCKLRDGICVGKTLLEKFQEEGVKLDTSQNLDGSLFNQKIEGTKNSAITFLKTLQIEKLNYTPYREKDSFNIKGTGDLKYLERKKFDYYSEQGFGNLGTDTPTPVLGRFIPYSYFYPNYRDMFGKERSLLDDTGIGTGTSQVYPYTFYNNLNYTQFIPYGKKSDYQYGFEDEKNIPTF